MALLPFATHAAKVYDVDDVPDTKKANRTNFISDPEHYLTPAVTSQINSRLLTLMDSTTVEMAIVIVPSIGDEDIFDFAQALAQKWGIGRSDNSNGLLLLMAIDDRQVRLHTGYGLEGVIPDATANHIITECVVPWMKGGNIDRAVESTVDRICTLLETPEAIAEIKSAMNEKHPALADDDVFARNADIFWKFLGALAFMFFCTGAVQFITTWKKSRREKSYNYGHAMAWRNSLPRMVLWTILSAGACLPFLLISFWRYRSWRTRRLTCDNCYSRMNRLPEDKDNDYLTSGEDCEEQLGTVDYDVWLCPDCGSIKKYAFIKNQNYYKECPACHHLAYGLKYERTITPSTVKSEGVGEKVYECRHCGHTDRTRFKIEKKPDPALLATAALAAGASRGRGGSVGGGFSGGSWGGGSFGGGGASGRW